jgi:hypothetical protein
MITVYVKQDCGCCTESLQFKDEESADKAFAAAGLGNGVEIVDDAGTKHGGLDTFYGFSLSDEEQGGRSLGYLLDKASGR